MSRWDLTGLFWDDYVPPKPPAEKVVRVAPEPVWLAPDYLPHWDQAKDYVLPEASDAEVASWAGTKIIWDTEFYENYALVGFLQPATGQVASFELWFGGQWSQSLEKLRWIAKNCTLVGFNDTAFDLPMLHAVLDGMDTDILWTCVHQLIVGEDGRGTRPGDFYKARRLTRMLDIDHIDLIALTPLGPGLKTCAGRLHAPRMADLPFAPGSTLSPEQVQVLRWYWYNDLQNTKLLHDSHGAAIALREQMSAKYNVDVRSKSDPQIAEQVIRKEITTRTGRKYIPRATIVPWRSFTYQPPAYLRFESPTLQWVLDFVCRQQFVIDQHGSPMMPAELAKLKLEIGNATYQMGIGGLHSQEKRCVHIAGDDYEISDNDVTSYYPSLIIQQGMYPPNVGPEFSAVFRGIVETRVAAKKSGDKGTAETLKIVANGTFGKTGERDGYSVVYYPEMMIQVTVTGQLSLLLLIERLELAGIPVISANTDGIIVKCPKALCTRRDEIMAQWERDTGLGLESKQYAAVYSRDVNNYVALLTKPEKGDTTPYRHAKAVGCYRKTIDVYPLKWNPTCEVCQEALIEYLATGRPIEDYVRSCTDMRKFVEVKNVTGGGVKDGVYLGKAVRWYYSTECPGEIVYAKNGYAVARTEGARPCMDLPETLPPDLDFAYYVERAMAMLGDFEPKKKKSASEGIAIAAQ